MDLFADQPPSTAKGYRPLADRLRPQSIEAIVGQGHLLDADAVLPQMLRSGQLQSLILWGPPGCGKTTLARLLSDHFEAEMIAVSAITSGVKELKAICDKATVRHRQGRQTLLFVDEIHRFNRAQQDVFLPYVESGAIILVGATTENPSFELNAALLSRCTVLVLNALDHAALEALMVRAEEEQGVPLPITNEARNVLVSMAAGDGRYLLGLCEQLFAMQSPEPLTVEQLAKRLNKRASLYDKGQEQHYNLISALHKALRASDVNAALYWMNRMLSAGEDPHYLMRRLVRFAVEDIGMADPNALLQANAAWQAFDKLGSPEGELAIAQAVIYLGTAPKSNAGYSAYKASLADARRLNHLAPPMHSVNAPTKLMQELGYSEGYRYDHNSAEGFSGQSHFPDEMDRVDYYQPVERGFERDIAKRLRYWEGLRAKANQPSGEPVDKESVE